MPFFSRDISISGPTMRQPHFTQLQDFTIGISRHFSQEATVRSAFISSFVEISPPSLGLQASLTGLVEKLSPMVLIRLPPPLYGSGSMRRNLCGHFSSMFLHSQEGRNQ